MICERKRKMQHRIYHAVLRKKIVEIAQRIKYNDSYNNICAMFMFKEDRDYPRRRNNREEKYIWKTIVFARI